MERRQFFKTGLSLAGSLMLPAGLMSPTFASIPSFNLMKGVRTLDLYRTATKERLSVEYLRDGKWVEDSYSKFCWILRDVRAGEVAQMDTDLLAVLDWTQAYLKSHGYTEPFYITSGYRSSKTNASTEGAARNSQHVLGKAVDLYVPGLTPAYLGKLFNWLSQGGVGIYADNGFVHVDTGRVRTWKGRV